ncbi:MAG: GAF domain-containing sensor histidine kinase [Chloroflexota bacterium]
MDTKVSRRLKNEFRRFNWLLILLLLLLVALLGGAVYLLSAYLGDTLSAWLPTLVISTLMLLSVGLIVLLLASALGNRVQTQVHELVGEELQELRAANDRARSLQAMASTLRATLSFERVVEAALDVCSLALEEMGIPSRTLVGAVFLYEDEQLVPVVTRSFIPHDRDQRIDGQKGIIGEALKQADPTVSSDPQSDPELSKLLTFQSCETAVCIPLRAGFQIFGAMIIGTEVPVSYEEEHLELFNSVADHAVIALQNAKLYQDLKAEKQRIIQADEDARRELARDLHDGPTQSVAAIAMRVNFIRSLIPRDPDQAVIELDKVEKLARHTSQEIRGMLFTLRPLVLETEGLAAAIDTVVERIQQSHNLPIRFTGEETAALLDEHAQSIVFSIVEEALNNARKYSEASHVQVRLWREDDLFVAQVRDDGVGFDIKSVNESYSTRGSLGMVNMQERAERVDGSLRIDSRPGKGTAVTLVVPLDKHGRDPDSIEPYNNYWASLRQ